MRVGEVRRSRMETAVAEVADEGLNPTNSAAVSKTKAQLRVLSRISLVAFGLSIFFGGALIHFVDPKIGRIRAEIEGQIMAVFFVAMSVAAIVASDSHRLGKDRSQRAQIFERGLQKIASRGPGPKEERNIPTRETGQHGTPAERIPTL